MATLIKVDGTIVEDIAVDTLAKQQHYVDGYIVADATEID